MKIKHEFSQEDINAFEPENKIGLLATVNENNQAHITLITTLMARNSKELIWGQFAEGHSKVNVKNNPKTAFLIMNLQRKHWRGKALWKQEKKEGEEFIRFNKLPMWRYNSYFGIHTAHYMDLTETTEKQNLPVASIIISAILTKIAKSAAVSKSEHRIMNNWTESFFNKLDTLKFLSYITDDGFPVLIPLLQCQAADSRRLVFNTQVYENELFAIKADTKLTILALSIDMKDVLVRGKFTGFKKHRGINLGSIDIDWVYNPMPPISGQIYPEQKVETVNKFDFL
ncbi:MAG: hypothetical protein JXR51_14130 [Bacteroidales bacterium]|nr:hypothetical protein [Bacteroidales bacterium]MBN2758307.1 hypothetical protein [Bacteroidales bacterium]